MKELGFLRLARALFRTSRTPDGQGPALPTAPNGSSGGSRCNPGQEVLKPVIDCPQPTNTWPCLSLSVHYNSTRRQNRRPDTSTMYDDAWYSFVPEFQQRQSALGAQTAPGHRRKQSLLQQPNVRAKSSPMDGCVLLCCCVGVLLLC